MKHNEVFGDAKWIKAADDCASPYFRLDFQAEEIASAVLTICGLGFFEAYLNGRRVSDDLLVPGFSQYNKRDLTPYRVDDELSSHTLVMKYDVKDYLTAGSNTVGIHLGGGWYDRRENGSFSEKSYGRVKLCFSLSITYTDGTVKNVISDENTLWSESPVTYTDIYRGERHDGALEKDGFSKYGYDCSGWKKAETVIPDEKEFVIQTCPPDRVVKKITPVKIKENGNRIFYDAGENVSGYLKIKSLNDNEKITVRYAEEFTEDGTELSFYSTGGDHKIQQEIFINTKCGKEYFPHFCWHAFRYIEVIGQAEAVEICVVHSDCKQTSGFECSNETLNWLYNAYIRTQLDNMHCGVPSDCPHIERLGYTGDGQLCAPAAMMLLDTREFYKKWMMDVADCQDVKTGHIQHTAPFEGGGGGPSAWGGAIIYVPYYYYKTFGDISPLQEYFPNMLKYLDYMFTCSEFGLIYKEKQDWCLGDWCAPTEYLLPEPHILSRLQIPETFVNTALFVKLMELTVEISSILGLEDRVSHLKGKIEQSKKALEIAYYSPMTKDFCGNVQGADAFAADIGLGGKETLEAMAEKYIKKGMLDTGIVATDILPRVLFENGYEQLAYDLLTSKGDISFYYMMTHGATTIWEDWHPERSYNHPMFGPCSRYLLSYFLGINQTEDSAGYEKILIAPKLVEGLDRANGFITTVRGKISVEFVKTEKQAEFTVEVPDNARFICKNTAVTLSKGINHITVSL